MKDSEERLRPCLQGATGVVIIGAETSDLPQAPASAAEHYPASSPAYLMDITLGHSELNVTSLSDSSPNTGHPQLLPSPAAALSSGGFTSRTLMVFPGLNYPSEP